MRPSRLRREREGLGGTADAHLSTSYHYWKVRETAWAMDRDDALPGRWVDRALDNLLPLSMDPQTGEPDLDAEFKRRFETWSEDPSQCDHAGRLAWEQLERLIVRTSWIAGDCPVPLHYEAGKVQAVEPDRLASPFDDLVRPGGQDAPEVVHGVEIDPETGEVKAYHFLKQRPGSRKWNSRPSLPVLGPEGYTTIPARDKKGRPSVLLIHDPKRISETRGITIFHGGFDTFGMIEDTNFAELQKQQTDSCIPVFVTSNRDVRTGDREEVYEAEDGETDTIEQLVPGTVPRLRPGESIQGVANSGSSANFEGFMRSQMRIAALQVGFPYSLLMQDTTGTTFHGYRGEFEQAKITFRRLQRDLKRQLHKPVWRMLAEKWAKEIEAEGGPLAALVRKARSAGTILRVAVKGCAWPYVEPEKDARADVLRQSDGLASPRQIAAERGVDYEDLVRESVDDVALAIRAAVSKSKELEEELEVSIPWQCLAPAWLVQRMAAGASATAAQATSDAMAGETKDSGDKPEGGSSVPDASEPADLAMNGAQVTALQGIVGSVSSGEMPVETAVDLIQIAFPAIPREQVVVMLRPVDEAPDQDTYLDPNDPPAEDAGEDDEPEAGEE